MEDLLRRSGSLGFKRGERVEARVIATSRNKIVLDLGGKSEAIIEGREYDSVRGFARQLTPGQLVRVTVVVPETEGGLTLVSLRASAIDSTWKKLEEAKEKGDAVSVAVSSITKGGITIDYEGISGFVPLSQIGTSASKSLQQIVGKNISVLVVSVERDVERVIFSEKQVSEKEMIDKQREVIKSLKKDEVLTGEISYIAPFGAFVKFNKDGVALEGLMHKSRFGEMSLETNGKIEVRVLGTDDDKISLGPNTPKMDTSHLEKDAQVKGKVLRLTGRTVIVEIEPGINASLPISSLPSGIALHVGETHKFFIESIDEERNRINVGLALKVKPVGYK